MATTATAPRGSGLYLRNRMWWVRVRTPASLEPEENSLRRFFRFSTRTSCFSEASRVAAHVRAALDRGFALARFEIGTSMVDAVQVEAMLTRLAQTALAAAEASRALAGVRDAARVAEACDAMKRTLAGGATPWPATSFRNSAPRSAWPRRTPACRRPPWPRRS